MPLLMCPNDNSPMQTLDRADVQFDMCPVCRGVWLDRGELEKLMAAGREDEPIPAQAPPRNWPPSQTYRRDDQRFDDRAGRRDYDDDDYRHRSHDGRSYKKRRGFDLFDIFD